MLSSDSTRRLSPEDHDLVRAGVTINPLDGTTKLATRRVPPLLPQKWDGRDMSNRELVAQHLGRLSDQDLDRLLAFPRALVGAARSRV